MSAQLPASGGLGPLSRTDFVRYQGASGDMNPVHHDETFCPVSRGSTSERGNRCFPIGFYQRTSHTVSVISMAPTVRL